MKGAISSKANAALDRAMDPEKELDVIIMDLETQRHLAIKELLSYKASAKQMEQSLTDQLRQAEAWEKRAMIAVKGGDDETAKECLRRQKHCQTEHGKIKRDQAEAAGYAAELNNSRKKVDVKLKMLKLRKGTMAAQIAASRSGGNVFGQSEELFDKLDEAERRIDEEVFEQQAMAELDGEQDANMALEAELLRASTSTPLVETENDPLRELKAKMATEKKLLKK